MDSLRSWHTQYVTRMLFQMPGDDRSIVHETPLLPEMCGASAYPPSRLECARRSVDNDWAELVEAVNDELALSFRMSIHHTWIVEVAEFIAQRETTVPISQYQTSLEPDAYRCRSFNLEGKLRGLARSGTCLYRSEEMAVRKIARLLKNYGNSLEELFHCERWALARIRSR